MQLEIINKKSPKTGKIALIIAILMVVLIIFISFAYYHTITKSEDPRISELKDKYNRYNNLLKTNNLKEAILTLDSIEKTYEKFEDFKNSFETGIVQNRKAANLLTLAHSAENDSIKYQLLDSAKICALKSIQTFEIWLPEYAHLTRNEIIMKINKYYVNENPVFKRKNLVDMMNKRADEIIKAQKEGYRQQSVAYTNLGTIYQTFGDYKMAIQYNKKALEIWNENKTAKNNLARLFGFPFK